jgi:uncharacterized protein YndB with AHSA1/START domain
MSTEPFEPVRKKITVNAPIETAFEVFTTGMGTWWNPAHHIGEGELEDVVIEPRDGGRWYETTTGGTCEWGKVQAWDPPQRVVLAWQLSADWEYDPSIVTELEIRFEAEGPETTRVELEHRGLEAYGDRVGTVRDAIDSEGGWTGLLAAFAAAVERPVAQGLTPA